MTIPVPVTPLRAIKVRRDHRVELPEHVVTEEPLEIRLAEHGRQSQPVIVTMRTPGNDFELAVGLLFTENLVLPNQIEAVSYCDGVREDPRRRYNTVTVRVGGARLGSGKARPFVSSASCGVCGKSSIEDVLLAGDVVAPLPRSARGLPGSVVVSMPDQLRRSQKSFDRTGGLHAAGLFDQTGMMFCAREDVGRHNAVDKVIGNWLLNGASHGAGQHVDQCDCLASYGLMVSGRVSFEIVQKAAIAGIGAICAVSAPTSLAVEAADALGLGLAGFVRGDSFNVYAHSERFDLDG